jgi:hypothetical protein
MPPFFIVIFLEKDRARLNVYAMRIHEKEIA